MNTTQITVTDRDGKVVIQSENGNYVLDLNTAVRFANAMLECATACGAEIEVMTQPKPISDEHRARLVTRCSHILRSMKGKKDEMVAYQIVDTILADTQ